MAEPASIDEADDPRVVAYTNIRMHGSRFDAPTKFVAEGRWVTERLLESRHHVESVLVTAGNESEWRSKIEELRPVNSRPILYAASKAVLRDIVGYDFHRGVLACGFRPDIPTIDSLDNQAAQSPTLDVFLDGISDAENVGNILRTSASLGVKRVILGPGTVDPFRRRVIRVSMASVFNQTFYLAEDSAIAVADLVRRGHRVIATTLDDDADNLDDFRRDERPMVVVLGNEATGISKDVLKKATDRLRITMANQVDSMNVASAAAIFLWRVLA